MHVCIKIYLSIYLYLYVACHIIVTSFTLQEISKTTDFLHVAKTQSRSKRKRRNNRSPPKKKSEIFCKEVVDTEPPLIPLSGQQIWYHCAIRADSARISVYAPSSVHVAKGPGFGGRFKSFGFYHWYGYGSAFEECERCVHEFTCVLSLSYVLLPHTYT